MTSSASPEAGRRLLEACPLFRGLDVGARGELFAHAHRRAFAAGAPICHVGDPGDSMMAVLVGSVRISLPIAKGKEVILADLPAGELLGEIALLDGKERSANVSALTNCELMVLERRHVLPFLEQNPKACLKLMELLCARIRRSDDRMSDIAFFDLPARLAKTILKYPASGRGPARLSLTQTELADMTGGTRENVNRCLRDWERRGILARKGGWTIVLKPEALQAIEPTR
jgi:CRP/FNR family transcriptional regulator, cyclic AMP receptor protein